MDETPEMRDDAERMREARDDARTVRVREEVVRAVSGVVEVWAADAGVGDVSQTCLALRALILILILIHFCPCAI